MFPAWMFGRIGYSLSELQHGDEREDYIQDVESRTVAKTQTLEEQYQKLSSAYSQLRDYAKAVEDEKNQLVGERTDLQQENCRLREGSENIRKIGDRFKEEHDATKAAMEKLRKESANLSYAMLMPE